jgi:hypothetical protein
MVHYHAPTEETNRVGTACHTSKLAALAYVQGVSDFEQTFACGNTSQAT